MVALTGLEPIWVLPPRDFKSIATADFATAALQHYYFITIVPFYQVS